jgi:hypothetical protein
MSVSAEEFHDAWVERGGRCDGTHAIGEALCQNVTAVLAAIDRAALSGSTAPLDRERMAQTGVNVWGWDISRARQYAETFAAEYDRLSAAASPDPAQGGGLPPPNPSLISKADL